MPLDGELPCAEARVLDKALELLGPNGEFWLQNRLSDHHGNRCMVGAILCGCAYLRIKPDQTLRLMVEAFSTSEFIPEGAGDIPEQICGIIQEFNDEPGRPFEHIRQVLANARELAISRC
jgi:hypothetical protein